VRAVAISPGSRAVASVAATVGTPRIAASSKASSKQTRPTLSTENVGLFVFYDITHWVCQAADNILRLMIVSAI
jgi:hypothetical protein